MTGQWQTCIRQVPMQWWLRAVWAGEEVYQEEGVLVTCGMPMMLSNAYMHCHRFACRELSPVARESHTGTTFMVCAVQA